MSQEPVEVTLPFTPGQEQPLFWETNPMAHTTIVLPAQPEGFSQLQKSWRQRVRHWVFRPSVGVFTALIIVATMYFCPVILSESVDGDRAYYVGPIDGPDLGGVCSSDATSRDA